MEEVWGRSGLYIRLYYLLILHHFSSMKMWLIWKGAQKVRSGCKIHFPRLSDFERGACHHSIKVRRQRQSYNYHQECGNFYIKCQCYKITSPSNENVVHLKRGTWGPLATRFTFHGCLALSMGPATIRSKGEDNAKVIITDKSVAIFISNHIKDDVNVRFQIKRWHWSVHIYELDDGHCAWFI